MEATLYLLDDALSPAANWVLELQDMKESLEEATGVKINKINKKNKFCCTVHVPCNCYGPGTVSCHMHRILRP